MRLLALLLVLTACAASSPGLPLCDPLPAWSDADQDRLAAELATDGPLASRAVHDLEVARAVDRACLQGSP